MIQAYAMFDTLHINKSSTTLILFTLQIFNQHKIVKNNFLYFIYRKPAFTGITSILKCRYNAHLSKDNYLEACIQIK